MNHCGTQTIETERLILRRFELNDAEAAYKNWMSDDEVSRFMPWTTHPNLSETQAVLAEWIANYEKDDFYIWAIELKETGEPIGSIGTSNCSEKSERMEVGYCISKKWWHKGIVSEALSAVIIYLFDKVGVNRIEAKHDPRNPNSGKVMKKCGMRYEGTLRERGRNNQGIYDECMYSILSSDRK